MTGIKKKVCLIIPSLQAGGMERVMSELAKYFCSNIELEVHLVLYGITRELFYQIPENIIVHQPEFQFENSKRIWSTLKTLWYVRHKIKKIHPETILSFGEIWNNFVLLSLLGLKFPVFVSDRNQPNKSLGLFHNQLRKWLYPNAKGVIAQTEKAKEIYSRLYKHKNIKVIGNPIRPILNQNNSSCKRKNVVLMVGRLIATKNHERLIEVFLNINKPGWKLVIIGYDHLKQNVSLSLQKIIQANKANDRIILAGKISDVDSYYLESKIFSFTSSSEGFPNVVGEALSAGLPVVSYDCIAGPSELISHGENGFLVPVFDDEKFGRYLEILMDNENLRIEMSNNAKLSVVKFNIEKICSQYLRFILEENDI